MSHRRGNQPSRGLWVITVGATLLLGAALWYLSQRPTPKLEPLAPPPSPAAPAPAPAKSVAKPQKRFDFYTILPEIEVIVPEDEAKSAKKPHKLNGAFYYLQAGSFRSMEEADAFKIQLITSGINTPIETHSVEAKPGEIWHRVRLGPFDDLNKMDKSRNRLAQFGVHAIPMRARN